MSLLLPYWLYYNRYKFHVIKTAIKFSRQDMHRYLLSFQVPLDHKTKGQAILHTPRQYHDVIHCILPRLDVSLNTVLFLITSQTPVSEYGLPFQYIFLSVFFCSFKDGVFFGSWLFIVKVFYDHRIDRNTSFKPVCTHNLTLLSLQKAPVMLNLAVFTTLHTS